MNTRVTEIADGIYQLSTHIEQAGPTGFTFNQFLVDGDEPLLFHTGLRVMFPAVAEAIATVMPLRRLRWITFGHFEADECGAMNDFLEAAPDATVAHGAVGVMVSVADQANRAPRVLADGDVLDLGGKRMRRIETPHVPHGWDAGLFYEETTGTLFAGDLLTRGGSYVRAHRRRSARRSDGVRDGDAVDVARTAHGAHDPSARRTATGHACADAQLRIHGRRRRGAARAGRLVCGRTAGGRSRRERRSAHLGDTAHRYAKARQP